MSQPIPSNKLVPGTYVPMPGNAALDGSVLVIHSVKPVPDSDHVLITFTCGENSGSYPYSPTIEWYWEIPIIDENPC